MHPMSNNPLSPWMVDASPRTSAGSSGPVPAKRPRLEAGLAWQSTLQLERPALIQPLGSTAATTGNRTGNTTGNTTGNMANDPADDSADDSADDWLSTFIRHRHPNAPENDRISPAGQAWQLGTAALDTLSGRLPATTAAWTRRLEFAGCPDVQDWRWLPAYRQHCPNLMEIVLPKDSHLVVPALMDHARREEDGRWVLSTPGRHDGVGKFQRLCKVLGRSLRDVVDRPDVLGSCGRPRVFDRLARDVVALSGTAPVKPALAQRIERLLSAIVDDSQVALRCGLVAQAPGTPADRLAAMEAIAAELRRAPFALPRSTCPLDVQDEVAGMIDGLSRATDVGAYTSETLFSPRRPRWLDRAEAAAMSRCLKAVPAAALTPALQALRDAAVQVLSPDPVFEDLVFLSREEEDVVSDALHLVRLLGLRMVLRPPGGLLPEAMPGSSRRPLAALRRWMDEAPSGDALRRERWYVHLAGQAHHGACQSLPTAGLLRGNAWVADLDAPPAALIADIARSRGEALGLTLDYRGEAVFDPGEVNRVLAERFSFGIRFSGAHLEAERAPAALRWPEADSLDIDSAGEGWPRDAWRRRVVAGLVSDFPRLSRLLFGGGEFPRGDDPELVRDLDVLSVRGRMLDEIIRLTPSLIWTGRQRGQLTDRPHFLSWLVRLIRWHRGATERDERAALRARVGPVLLRVLDDGAFASQCEAMIRSQDGGCADAYLRVLHQMALLNDAGEASDTAAAVEIALRFACGLRADQWVVETHGDFNETLEEAMLLRQAVRTRLGTRLGHAPAEAADVGDTPIYAHLGIAGDRWRDDEVTRRRDRQADALIDAEIESGFATSHDCLVPGGLVGDHLSKVLDRESGHRAHEARLLSEAQARFDAVIDAAGDDDEAVRAANDAASQAYADMVAALATRRREQVLPPLAALAARLSPRRTDDTPSAAP